MCTVLVQLRRRLDDAVQMLCKCFVFAVYFRARSMKRQGPPQPLLRLWVIEYSYINLEKLVCPTFSIIL